MMHLPQIIFLTGFMGCGKSSIGKKLANELNYNFFDLDKEIEKANHTTISELFNKVGELFFREIETKELSKIAETLNKTVVALGGGTVCFNDNLNVIKQKGCLIYLQLDPKSLYSRLVNAKTKRPLLQNLNNDELLLFIETKLKERETYYLSSHIILNGLSLTPNRIINEIEIFYK